MTKIALLYNSVTKIACIDNNLEIVEFLVDSGADINRCDMEGWTPLHATASCGSVSMAEFLISRGADLSVVNNDGELAIDVVDEDDMAKLLQEEMDKRGIDCDASRSREERRMLEDAQSWLNSGQLLDNPHPKTGATALHVAAAKGYMKVMRLLLEAGTDVDTKDFDGWTPLHAAAHWGQAEAVEILCDHMADLDSVNNVGQTPYDLADDSLESLKPLMDELRRKQASAKLINQNKVMSKKRKPSPTKDRSSKKEKESNKSSSSSSDGTSSDESSEHEEGAKEDGVRNMGTVHTTAVPSSNTITPTVTTPVDMNSKENDVVLRKNSSSMKDERKMPRQNALSCLTKSPQAGEEGGPIPEGIVSPKRSSKEVDGEGTDYQMTVLNGNHSTSHVSDEIKTTDMLNSLGVAKQENDNTNLPVTDPAQISTSIIVSVSDLSSSSPPTISFQGDSQVSLTSSQKYLGDSLQKEIDSGLRRTSSLCENINSNNIDYTKDLGYFNKSYSSVFSNRRSLYDSLSNQKTLKTNNISTSSSITSSPLQSNYTNCQQHILKVSANHVTTPSSTPTTTSTSPTRQVNSSSPLTPNGGLVTASYPSKKSVTSPSSPTAPTLTITNSAAETPTTPEGGSIQQSISKLSAGSVIKNFFKSFAPPSRDEESETQRKAHAKMVRSTRRSTQGITLEDLKSAEQYMKNRTTTTTTTTATSTVSSSSSSNSTSTLSATTPSASATVEILNSDSTAPSNSNLDTTTSSNAASNQDSSGLVNGEMDDSSTNKRPSWRLKVDSTDKNRFCLENVRPKAKERAGDTDAAANASQQVTNVSLSLKKKPTQEEKKVEEKPSEDKSSTTREGTQAVIQRRKKAKRRSTGVVHVDLDEIDPDRKSEKRSDDEGALDDGNLAKTIIGNSTESIIM
ncbi:Protein phosphatase 1 regulatory subunit 12A [Armadillidium vulgare]|nr:Protein phosphatase 1 regulatory subunit 12A [Armadillidium vulgare]